MSGKILDIGVIGAGPAGLYAAYLLQKAGHRVTVFESEGQVGGRMSTRVKDGFSFDIGANFLIKGYPTTKKLVEDLGLNGCWQKMLPLGDHYTVRNGKLCQLTFRGLSSLLNFDALNWKSKIYLLWMFLKTGLLYRGLSFFDLLSLPDELNQNNAYDYVTSAVSREAADYIIDAFTSMYQFHSSEEISSGAMLSLVSLMVNGSDGFVRTHTRGREMSAIPEALAKDLAVKLNCPAQGVYAHNEKIRVIFGGEGRPVESSFDRLIIATTCGVVRKIYDCPSRKQQEFLDSIEFASTINVSFKVPSVLFDGIGCVAIPRVENTYISEFTNESLKGMRIDGRTIINVGMHEGTAKMILKEGWGDEEIFTLVKRQLVKVCPFLAGKEEFLVGHDIARWREAMPKFSCELVSAAKRFWKEGQGDRGIYLAGDYTGFPWVEGALISGKKVSEMILASDV